MINPKYQYLLSVAYIRATVTKVSMKTWLDDYNFPDLRRASRFTNRDTNLFKATSRVKRQGKLAIKNVFQTLRAELHGSAKNSACRMVTALIKPNKLCPVSYNLARLPMINDYFKLSHLMTDVRHELAKWQCQDLVDSTESTQQGMNAYVHNHMLFSTDSDNVLNGLGAVLNLIASTYGYTVELAPLINRNQAPVVLTDRDSPSDENYQTIARFINYIYKQYKLPVAYGSDDKARATYQRFMALSKAQQRTFIEAIENSTQSIKLRHHVSYKRYVKHYYREATRSLAGVYFELHKFNVVEATSLLKNTYEAEPQNARRVSHHYTSEEQWTKATREQMIINKYLIKSGANELLLALSDGTCEIIKVNKKATTNGSDGYTYDNIIIIYNDRMRASGIPP